MQDNAPDHKIADPNESYRLVPETWIDSGNVVHFRTDTGVLCPLRPNLFAQVKPTDHAIADDLCAVCQEIASNVIAIELPANLRKREVVA